MPVDTFTAGQHERSAKNDHCTHRPHNIFRLEARTNRQRWRRYGKLFVQYNRGLAYTWSRRDGIFTRAVVPRKNTQPARKIYPTHRRNSSICMCDFRRIDPLRLSFSWWRCKGACLLVRRTTKLSGATCNVTEVGIYHTEYHSI